MPTVFTVRIPPYGGTSVLEKGIFRSQPFWYLMALDCSLGWWSICILWGITTEIIYPHFVAAHMMNSPEDIKPYMFPFP